MHQALPGTDRMVESTTEYGETGDGRVWRHRGRQSMETPGTIEYGDTGDGREWSTSRYGPLHPTLPTNGTRPCGLIVPDGNN